MTLCSDHHDEVCYEGRACPACEFVDKLDAVTAKRNEAEERVKELEEEVSNLESQIEELTKEPVINEIRKANNP